MTKLFSVIISVVLAVLAGLGIGESVKNNKTNADIQTTSAVEQTASTKNADNMTATKGSTQKEAEKLIVKVNGKSFEATFEDNEAVNTLKKMIAERGSVTVNMSDYSGFEKVGSLGESLPTSDKRTTTHSGDIVLYSGNQIVVFYGSNTWAYTRLAKVDNLSGWKEALGNGDITLEFAM